MSSLRVYNDAAKLTRFHIGSWISLSILVSVLLLGFSLPSCALTNADVVYYGNYPQGGTSPDFKVEPIMWRVLEASGDKALLLSEKILDGGVPFNPSFNFNKPWSSWWSESQIRKFLNGDAYEKSPDPKWEVTNPKGYAFYEKAFTEGERNAIVKQRLDNSVRWDYNLGFDAGPETEDKIFLLSYADVDGRSDKVQALGGKYGFVDDSSRKAEVTSYIATQGDYEHLEDGKRYSYWWLRSPGSLVFMASSVYDGGFPGYNSVAVAAIGLRPAFRLNLESLLFTSPATGGKLSGVNAELKKQDYDGTYTHVPSSRDFTEHKLTLATDTYKLESAGVTSSPIAAGTNVAVTLKYAGASTGAGYHLAAVVTSGDRALYYGQIKSLERETDESGAAAFTIPEYKDGEEVHLFVEGRNNGDYKTDFAGVPICIAGTGRVKESSTEMAAITKSNGCRTAPWGFIALFAALFGIRKKRQERMKSWRKL